MAQKARNRLSSAQLTVPVTDATDGSGKRSSKRRPTISRRPSPKAVPEEDEQDNKEEVSVIKVAKEEVDEAPPVALVVPKHVGTLQVVRQVQKFLKHCKKLRLVLLITKVDKRSHCAVLERST